MSHKGKAFEPSAHDPLQPKNYAQQLLDEFSFFDEIESYDAQQRWLAVRHLMRALGLLYLEYFQFHPEEAMAFGSAHEPLLRLAAGHIEEEYIRRLRRLTASLDEPELWERACWERTRVEAFNAMFGETVGFFDSAGFEDLEAVEERMQEAKHNFSIEDHRIPQNVPESHWWWFNHFDEHLDMATRMGMRIEKFEKIIAILNKLEVDFQIEREVALRKFMEVLGRVFLSVFQFHPEESRSCAAAHQRLIMRHFTHIKRYLSELEAFLAEKSPYLSLWERACWERTNIEAFNVVCGEVARLDTTRVEKLMQEAWPCIKVMDTDTYFFSYSTPESHWWWSVDLGE